jgi:hypothetical protein
LAGLFLLGLAVIATNASARVLPAARGSELHAYLPSGKEVVSPREILAPPQPVVIPPRLYIRPRWSTMSVSMDVLVRGRPLPVVPHEGRLYLPVPRLGDEYEIRVSNHGARRITAIVSVDGLSVINGQPATANHSGYLVAPGDHIVIKGWRRDLHTVAAFTFEERARSYASQVGHPENVGVIGLVAIEEQVWDPHPFLGERDPAAPAMKRSAAEVGGTGTGYGRDVDSRVTYGPFVRSANRKVLTYYYDTIEALRRSGVPVERPAPMPFPADGDFAPPPPGLRAK